jgi:hypothetical protein
MKCRKREGWLSEQLYVSGWSYVANSEGGANVGRLFLRNTEAGKELGCDWSKAQRRMGSSERIRQARRDCTLQTVDCSFGLKRQIRHVVRQRSKEELIDQEGHAE